jgi:glucan phosphoethanolaminetransferase (alkaline phosphatase superfamily)
MFWTVVFGVIFAFILIKIFPFILAIFISIFLKIKEWFEDNKKTVSSIFILLVFILGVYLFYNSESMHKVRESKCPPHSFYDPVYKNCFCSKPYTPNIVSTDWTHCILDNEKSKKLDEGIIEARKEGFSDKEIYEHLIYLEKVDPEIAKAKLGLK